MMYHPSYYPQPVYYDTRIPKHAYGPTSYVYTTYANTPSHTRHASYDTTPRYNQYQQQPYVTELKTAPNFAAETDRMRAKANKSSKKTASHKKDRVHVKIVYDEEDGAYYEYRSPKGTPPPPYDQRYAHPIPDDDPPVYKTKTRARATSTPQKPTRHPSTKAKKSSAAKPSRKATSKDAAKAGIPSGFSLKNWDPEEEPILLLGSVFDANTLGKWIYDWTVYHHGAGSPMADQAGELWLSLIELASKMKRSDECLDRIRRRSKRELVEDFIDEGEDFLYRLDAILRACEDSMWEAARRENGGVKTRTLGSSSGCAFVDSIFGRDRELERTEQLMADVRYWTHRFNTVCEPILRHPKD